MKTRSGRWRVLLLLILFLVAFIPRVVYPVSRPLQWYERSSRFVDAVLDTRWADTIVSEHPGVTPMWLVGLAQRAYQALRRAGGDGDYALRAVERAFRTEVFVSTLLLALAIALSVVLIWVLLKALFGESAAWAGAGFIALDPFHIAMSKVVHLDALLSVLMLLSALSLLVYLRRNSATEGDNRFWPRHRMLLASGVVAGLAFLTKSPAYFLVPYLGLCLLVLRWRAPIVKGYLLPVLLWVGAAAATYILFWPAIWVQPLRTLATVFGGVIKHAGRPHPQPLYYLGRLVSEDPGPGYYLVSVLVKTTALSLPLLLVGLFSPIAKSWRRERRHLWLVVGYFVFFVIQMSLGAKKAPRYLLPAFPMIAVIAGIGLITIARRLATWRARLRPSVLVPTALAIQALLVLPYHPYYVIHANLLVGGPSGAQRLLLATPEGEGLDMAADFLNSLPGASHMRVGVQLPAREAFLQHLVGETADTRDPDLDYLVFAPVYVNRRVAEDQWGTQWEQYSHRVPEYTAMLRGEPYAWVYAVDDGPQIPAAALKVCLGERIQLDGYTLVRDGALLQDEAVRPGDVLQLTLHWQAMAAPEGDYSVFVHLLGPDGAMVAQQDGVPLRGTYPTPLWGPGERVDDPHELLVPEETPPGPYRLVAGMYDWRSGERLAATADCTSPLRDDRIDLAAFDVGRERAPWWQLTAWALAGGLALGGIAICLVDARRPDD